MSSLGSLRWLPPVVVLLLWGGTTTASPFEVQQRSSPRQQTETPPPRAPQRVPFSFVTPSSVIATVTSAGLVARAAPDADAAPIASFSNRAPGGGPQVFLLTARPGERPETQGPEGAWYEALLPVRPNGTVGFLPAEDVALSTTPYRLVVDRAAFSLTLWKGAEVVEKIRIGLGTGATPTPVGRFYLASLVKPSKAGTVYGSFAYGLSGYSEVLTEWRGGGVVGLHGTNDPASVGKRASHGCIRMLNSDIDKLVPQLPLGTPIEIL